MSGFKKNPILFFLAILVGVGFCASALTCLLAEHWSGKVRPSVVSHGDNRIYLASCRYITVFDDTGKHQFSVPIAELGIGRPRAIHALGGDKVLISDAGDVLECDLPNRSCRTLIQNATRKSARRAGAVILHQKDEVVYVAESNKQLISAYHGGRLTGAIDGGAQKLKYPKDILLERDGHLVVADAGSHRIAAFRTGKETLGELAWSFSIQTDRDDETYYPIQIESGVNGSWWAVLQKFDHAGSFRAKVWKNLINRGRRFGALVILDAQGKVIRRVSLPDGTRPTQLIPMPQAMLALDFKRMQLIPISHAGDVLDEFHAPDLFQQFDAFQQDITHYQRLRGFGFAGAILSAFLLTIITNLARWREEMPPEKTRESQTLASGTVYAYRQNYFFDKGLVLLFAFLMLIFWCLTVAMALEDGDSLLFVVKLNLAVDFCSISLLAILWYLNRRRNAIQVSLTKEGICYRDHKGQVEIGFSSIEDISFTKFFVPGWLTVVSRSQTISFGMGFEQVGSFVQELKTALEDNNLAGRYDEDVLLGICKRLRIRNMS